MADWLVVFQPAYDLWAGTTADDEEGSRRRETVLSWLTDRYDDLPKDMKWNAAGRCYEGDILAAAVVIEFQAYAFESPQQFVVQ